MIGCLSNILASSGEDGIVRVWELVESERSIESEIPDIDPSCVYFKVNHFSELAPLFAAKEKTGGMFKTMRVSSHSSCVVFPLKVIRISDKPLHEFHGHNSEVLDLSWSNNKHLLSSSVDNTVRLWQVGQDQCLKIFSHNNYVTSVHFNPVDDDYFISGSIDGKVRIWTISGSQVVNWADINKIVTTVSYRPELQLQNWIHFKMKMIGCLMIGLKWFNDWLFKQYENDALEMNARHVNDKAEKERK